jgi:ABC-type branched-subunit amino acid transport system substrate-binding protein
VLGQRVSADEGDDNARLAIIRPEGEPYENAESELLAHLGPSGEGDSITLVYQPPYLDIRATVDSLVDGAVGRVLFLGSAGQLKRLAEEAQSRGFGPDLLLPGVFAGPEMFKIDSTYPGRLLVGYSTTPADHTEEGIRRFESLHEKYDLDYRRAASQISAFVAMDVLAEGLKRAGRDLSREKLVDALEGLNDFRSGLIPPISFNHSRRIGALGGYVLSVDFAAGKFGDGDSWIPL